MANELDASMCIQEKGGLINLKIDSKINPINISFKWNEEFIHSPPVKPGETFKVLCITTYEAFHQGQIELMVREYHG